MAAAPVTEAPPGAAPRAASSVAVRRVTSSAATGLAVGLVAASLPLHALMLLDHAHGPVLSGLMAAMVLWCLWCAAGVVRVALRPGRAGVPGASPATGRGHAAPLRHLWAMALAMAMLHVVLLTGFPFSTGGHHHGGSVAGAASGGAAVGPDAGAGLMLAVVGVELAICFACSVALRFGRQAS